MNLARLARAVQPVLALAHVFVLFCGLAVISVGVWSLLADRDYYTIVEAGDTQGTRIPTSLIVAGIVVSLLAALGLLGALLVSTYSGRILLAMYAFVLFLIIIMEVGCASAAVRYQEQLKDAYTDSAKRSQRDAYCNEVNHTQVLTCVNNQTSDADWDLFQRKHQCCGSTGYESYNRSTLCPQSHLSNITNGTNATDVEYQDVDMYVVTGIPLSVPQSCCNLDKLNNSSVTCPEVSCNVTSENVEFIYQRGCPRAVLDTLRHHQLIISVSVFIIAIVQIVGVASASIMVYANSREKQASNSQYKRLWLTATASASLR